MATQSRSTLLAFFFVVMICWIFACVVSRNLFATALRILIGVTVCSFLILNFSSVFDALQGEGIYERNVQSRAIHVQDALEKIPENPVFGGGVKYTTIDETGAGIHNSFLNFSVKSGVPSAIILLLLVTLPIMLFGQNFRNFMLASAMSIGIIFELLLYPGMVNENIVLMFLIVKFSAHYSQSSDFRA